MTRLFVDLYDQNNSLLGTFTDQWETTLFYDLTKFRINDQTTRVVVRRGPAYQAGDHVRLLNDVNPDGTGTDMATADPNVSEDIDLRFIRFDKQISALLFVLAPAIPTKEICRVDLYDYLNSPFPNISVYNWEMDLEREVFYLGSFNFSQKAARVDFFAEHNDVWLDLLSFCHLDENGMTVTYTAQLSLLPGSWDLSQVKPTYKNAAFVDAPYDSLCVASSWIGVPQFINIRGLHEVPPMQFTIQAAHSAKCLDVAGKSLDDGANVQQWTCSGADNQSWLIQDAGTGLYRIIAKHSGKCLTVYGGNVAIDGANVVQYSEQNSPPLFGLNQLWSIRPADDGMHYSIVSKFSGRCLDVAGGTGAVQDGANVQQWGCGGAANQLWRILTH